MNLPPPPVTAAPPAVDQSATGPIGDGAAADQVPGRGGDGHNDPVLCQHCGRTAANGISCIGMCVADSGY